MHARREIILVREESAHNVRHAMPHGRCMESGCNKHARREIILVREGLGYNVRHAAWAMYGIWM